MNWPDEQSADALIIVGRAVRTRGLKGEILADLLTDFPERFDSISELVGVEQGGKRQQLKLENYWFQNDRVVLKFLGYDTIEMAKTLVGYEFGVPEAQRVPLGKDEFYDWELQGCAVELKQGATIGKVSEVMRTGGVELLVVEGDAQEEHLIPMAGDIVVKIDVSAKRIVIDPPDGLLDL
jgi:16S rRNA processing protein RimM